MNYTVALKGASHSTSVIGFSISGVSSFFAAAATPASPHSVRAASTCRKKCFAEQQVNFDAHAKQQVSETVLPQPHALTWNTQLSLVVHNAKEASVAARPHLIRVCAQPLFALALQGTAPQLPHELLCCLRIARQAHQPAQGSAAVEAHKHMVISCFT